LYPHSPVHVLDAQPVLMSWKVASCSVWFAVKSAEYGVLRRKAHKGLEGWQEKEHLTEAKRGNLPRSVLRTWGSRSWARNRCLRWKVVVVKMH